MRKLTALMLVFVLAFGVLSGCSKAPETSTESNSPETSSSSNPADNTASPSDSDVSDKDTSELKIAVVLSGSANDGGWSQMGAEAAGSAAEKYGCTVNYSESVASTDGESTIRGYADAGYDIIVTHGAEFLDAAKLIAPNYLDVQFVCTSARSGQEPNLTAVDFDTLNFGFLCGAATAMVTETKKIGAVGSKELDSIVLWVEGVKAGAAYIDPECEVIDVYTGSFEDAIKAKQAVDALMDKGVDTVTQDADACGIGAVQQCTELGLYNIGAVSDQSNYGDAVLVSILQDAKHGIEIAVEKAINGELEAGAVQMGAADGVITITDYTGIHADAMTQEEKDKLQELWEMSRDGTDLSTLNN